MPIVPAFCENLANGDDDQRNIIECGIPNGFDIDRIVLVTEFWQIEQDCDRVTMQGAPHGNDRPIGENVDAYGDSIRDRPFDRAAIPGRLQIPRIAGQYRVRSLQIRRQNRNRWFPDSSLAPWPTRTDRVCSRRIAGRVR